MDESLWIVSTGVDMYSPTASFKSFLFFMSCKISFVVNIPTGFISSTIITLSNDFSVISLNKVEVIEIS